MIDFEKLREKTQECYGAVIINESEFIALLDYAAQLEKDAGRWNAATRNMALNDVCVVVYDNFGDGRTVTGEDADKAIDTAMESKHG